MSDFGYGQQEPSDSASEFNAHSFLISQMIGRVHTATVVKIISCTNSGGVSQVGNVNVQLLVNQLDGQGNSVPHGTVFNLCYFRCQGGTNAVIMDPQPGDIGFAVIADRDISAVKATKGAANPGSHRQFDLADGVYIGGILNGIPQQYIQFVAGGVNVVSPAKITLQAPIILLDGAVEVEGQVTGLAGGTITLGASLNQIAGSITTVGDVTAGGIDLQGHVHTGVQTGGGNTGPATG